MKKSALIFIAILSACGGARTPDVKYHCDKMCGYISSEPPYTGCKNYDNGYVDQVAGQDAFRHARDNWEMLFYRKTSEYYAVPYYESIPPDESYDPRGMTVDNDLATIITTDSSYECRKK